MSIKSLLPLFACLLLFSCRQETVYYDETIDFFITSPKASWLYYENAKIMLAVNVNTNDITWSSDISGNLGRGNHLAMFLPQGLHRITADIAGYKKDLLAYVSPAADDLFTILVNYSPMEIKMKSGACYSYAYAHDGSAENLRIGSMQAMATAFQEPLNMPKRDMQLPMPAAAVCVDRGGKPGRNAAGALSVMSYNIGDKRSFFVINTNNQTGEPHQVEAELAHQSDALSVWLTDTGALSGGALNECIQLVETLILPRVEALWGKPADIDNDGRIALLFTRTINDEEVALGFFNPSDFFMRNSDVLSDSYNPSSNEMDIIYAALPDDSPNSAYASAYVNATIAHELAHAATFTAKTWSRVKGGNKDAQREELFLDEGWSHLTENLCGLGISGGNINFLKRYFEDTSMYSLCGPNRDGYDDSAGMRGAISLFLSWLFWEAGGLSWDSADPVKLIDQGGIAFLRRMVESPQAGWESIGLAFGKPVPRLFNDFLNGMHNYRISNRAYNYKTDPSTNEAVDFFVNMGGSVGVGFPRSSPALNAISLEPWSFAFFDQFMLEDDALLTLEAGKTAGSVFYSYSVR